MEIGRSSRVVGTDLNGTGGGADAAAPGKRTLTEQLPTAELGPVSAGVEPRRPAGEGDGVGAVARSTLRVGSHGDDVAYLQEKLNALMQADLDVDGKFGPATQRAVRAFQAARGLGADGVVGPLTWGALDGAGPATVAPETPPVPPGGAEIGATPGATIGSGTPDHTQVAGNIAGAGPATPEQGGAAAPATVDGVRQAIVATARGELGIVHAKLAGPADETGKATRVGWERLMQYFELAFGGSGKGKFTPDVVKYHHYGMGNNGLVSWCGIFAVWACKSHGVPLGNWKLGVGVSSMLKSTSDPQPGDIGYVDQPYQHHCIVAAVNGDSIVTIDGNSGVDSTVTENTHARKHFSAFYRIPI